MRIKALEDIKSNQYILATGDIITVPNEQGIAWCSNGWAKDINDVVPTGQRVLQTIHVYPKNTSVVAKTLEV